MENMQNAVSPIQIIASLVAQLVKNPPAMKKTWVRSLSWEDPLEEGMHAFVSHLYVFFGEMSV